MYHKILVATDGSEPARRAVELGADLARLHGAHLVLLHVVNMEDEMPDWVHYADAYAVGFISPAGRFGVTPAGPGQPDAMAKDITRSRELARQAAERLLVDSRKIAAERGVRTVEALLEEGDAADRIVEAAKREDASVIVMGSRGHGPVKELLAGSVSSKVARGADRSCIAVT